MLTTVPSWLFKQMLEDYDVKIDCICTAKEAKAVKPNPQIYRTVLETLGVKPHEALMVGDTPEIDIIPPKKIGMKTALLYRTKKKTIKQADQLYLTKTAHRNNRRKIEICKWTLLKFLQCHCVSG